MANLFKPRLTRYINAEGHRISAGKAKDSHGKLLPGVRMKQERAKKWYGKYRDENDTIQREPLCTDKSAAQTMLNELVRKVDRRQAGMTDPFEAHRKRKLAEHLADYRRHLEAKGNSPDYIAQTTHYAELIMAGCGFRRLTDLAAAPVADWLQSLVEAGRSHATFNYYLTAIKGFCRWLVRDRRMPDNPLAHLSKLNEKTDVRVERRSLPPGEFVRLIESARGSEKVFRRLSGPDRAMLYVVAAYSGLRASELASLGSASLALAGDPPTIDVQAGYSKRRRRDTQPLPKWLAEQLAGWLAERWPQAPQWPSTLSVNRSDPESLNSRQRPSGAKLWPGSWPDRAAKMLRVDLEAAGIPYVDESGRVFDFHALRHQFISSLAAAGVHPKVAQQLARHSTIGLTMDRYTHLAVADVAGALDRLPEVPADGNQSEVVRATGTDGKPSSLVVPRVVPPDDFSGHFVSANDHKGVEKPQWGESPQEAEKPLKNRGFQAEGTGLEPARQSPAHLISSEAASQFAYPPGDAECSMKLLGDTPHRV